MEELGKGGGANELSSDIHVITAEINAYQRVAGEAIFEIGKRLKHVKENDLAHGEWAIWCESIGIDRSNANKFIRVYRELNVVTSPRLGLDALYQIALMPPDSRYQTHTIPSTGETKTVDEMTVRELREVKKALKEERQLRQQAEQNYEGIRQAFESHGQQEPEVQYVEVPDTESQEKVKRYEELFGDVSLYEGKTTRVTNGDAITYSVFEFTEDVRQFIEKYGHLTHFAREFNAMIDEGKSEYSNAVNDLYTFLKSLERNLNQNESVIIDQ
jgi:ribosomal protein L7/L12